MKYFKSPENRDEWNFYFAKLTMIISAMWILIVGTQFLSKKKMTVELNNIRLSENTIPIASTEMPEISNVLISRSDGSEFCRISGKYSIVNSGKIPFVISSANLKLYILPQNTLSPNAPRGSVLNRTLENRLADSNEVSNSMLKYAGHTEVMGQQNRFERLFTFDINLIPNTDIAVVANAKGGIPKYEKVKKVSFFGRNRTIEERLDNVNLTTSEYFKFGHSDLKHTRVIINPCTNK